MGHRVSFRLCGTLGCALLSQQLGVEHLHSNNRAAGGLQPNTSRRRDPQACQSARQSCDTSESNDSEQVPSPGLFSMTVTQTTSRFNGLASTAQIIPLFMLVLFCLSLPMVRARLEDEQRDIVIGINLGTVYSRVAVKQGDHIEIIADEYGHKTLPSWASLDSDENPTADADSQVPCSLKDGHSTFDVRWALHQHPHIEYCPKFSPSHNILEPNHPTLDVQCSHQNSTDSPVAVLAVIVTRLKQKAETYLGRNVTQAVVAVPPHFNEAQRTTIKDAGAIAGLDILRIINEPTAVAIAYGLGELDFGEESYIIVYDFGGGTLDASLLSTEDGVFEILATANDFNLGGENINEALVNYFIALYKNIAGVDIEQDYEAFAILRHEIERAKRALSFEGAVQLRVGPLEGGIRLEETLTREVFEELAGDLFSKSLKPLERVLADAGITAGQVDHVVLAGGSSRIPKVQSLVKDFFKGKEPLKDIDPPEAVIRGAAIQGGIFSEYVDDILGAFNTTPLALGVKTPDGSFTEMIFRNSILPSQRTRIFSVATGDSAAFLVKIFVGTAELADENLFIGEIELDDVGQPYLSESPVEVSFAIDACGILNVEVIDQMSGRSASIQLDANWDKHIPYEELEHILSESEARRNRFASLVALQSRILHLRAGISGDGVLAGNLEDVHDALGAALHTASEWVDEHTEKADEQALVSKLAELEAIVSSLVTQVSSDTDRSPPRDEL